MIPKKFTPYVITDIGTFNTTKFSANESNTTYFLGSDQDTIYEGVPDVLYQYFCTINPLGIYYTYGRFNVQSIDSDEDGLIRVSDVKNALSKGMKCIDLSTYQGTENEIAKHNGATSGNLVNGYDYKCVLTPNSSGTSDYYSDKTFTEIPISSVNIPHIYKWYFSGLVEGYRTIITVDRYPQTSDIVIQKNSQDNQYRRVGQIVDEDTFIYTNGIEATFIEDFVPTVAFMNEDELIGYLCYDDQDNTCLYIPDGLTYKFITVSIHSEPSTVSWVQTDAQPSTVSDVNDLKSRMTTAEGKITTLEGKSHTQNTDTQIVSGNNSVVVSSSGTLITGNGSVTGNLSVSGNLNVTGTETVTEIVHVESENDTITLRKNAQTAISSGDLSGTFVENYDGLNNDLLFGTDASGVFRIGDANGTLEPIATRDEASNLTDGQAMTWDATNQRLVGKTIDSTPTTSSTNLITSGGVKSAIDAKQVLLSEADYNALQTKDPNIIYYTY